MKTATTFIPQEQVHRELFSGINNIDSLYSKINLILHEDLYPLEKDSYHFIGKLLKKLAPADRTTRALASTLFKSCYQSELLSAGGANIAYLFGVTLVNEMIKTSMEKTNAQILLQQFDKVVDQFKNQVEKNSSIPSPNNIRDVVDKICGSDKVLAQAIWEALNLAGLEGRIFVENGRQDNFFIELKEGYTFQLKPFKFMLEKNTWERRNCKLLVVDGLVEKVSEIDHLLTKCLETKIPMVIIAHGFSEEVVATLKANQERGLLDVQPVRVPSDIDSLNIVNDIAVVCGSLPVSSMKGDLVVFTKYDELPLVERVRLDSNECTIENGSTRAAVASQAQSILQKRQNYFLHEEVQELFDKRLRSLVSNSVLVHLPNLSSTKNDEQRVKIDIALRQIKTMLHYGTVNLVNELKYFCEEFTTAPINDEEIEHFFKKVFANFSERLKQEKVQKVPAISSIGGIMLAGKAIMLLMTSSGFVKFTGP